MEPVQRMGTVQYLVVLVVQLLKVGSNLLLQLLVFGVEALDLLLSDVELTKRTSLKFRPAAEPLQDNIFSDVELTKRTSLKFRLAAEPLQDNIS